MENFRHWIGAMRLRTLPLALSSILAGSSVAYDQSTQFVSITLWAICTTLFLQILSNLANDYGDSHHGTDNEFRIGPVRSVQSGAISSKSMLRGIIICAILSFISGFALIYTSFWGAGYYTQFFVFLGFGLLAITAAIRYTAGKNPYGYRGLGDLYVLAFFGILGVCGTFYVHTKMWEWSVVLLALTIGTFAAAVLNLNNMRDRENDRSSGKNTLVVRLGIQKAMNYHLMLFAVGWGALIVYLILSHAMLTWIVLIFLPFHIIHLTKVFKHEEPKLLDPELKKIALSTFGVGLILFFSACL
jgi:1,4-dihydroxy-2-naphthoate polyprenyltransferase